jgi:hypothetical protein
MTKTKIAALAAVLTVLAAPAFAGDQDTATLLQDSGRYVPQARVSVGVPAGAYASAQKSIGARRISQPAAQYDFQLVGHN